MNLAVDINSQDNDGKIPIHYTINFGDDEMVRLLRDKGSDLNIKDNDSINSLTLEPQSLMMKLKKF